MRRDHIDAETPADRLGDLLARVARRVALDIHVSVPATVVSYNATTQRATVTLGFRAVEDGAVSPDPPIQIANMPVRWERGVDSYDTRPLAAGATGQVFFADRALDEWLRQGGSVDPIDARAHSLADGVFYPGVGPSPISPPPNPAARVIEAPVIMLGSTATLHAALAETLHAYLLAMITAAPVTPTDGGAAFKAGLISYLGANPPAGFATTKVLAE